MDTKKKCAHPACNCVPPEGKSYCSTSCEDAKMHRISLPVPASSLPRRAVEAVRYSPPSHKVLMVAAEAL